MQLTFDRFQERTDLKGKTFLDLEMTLTLSEPKRVRLKFSIPATEEPDQQTLDSFRDVTLWVDERIDEDLS